MKNIKNIIVFGSSGHAKVVIDAIQETNKYNIIGLVDDFKEEDTEVFGYKVLGKVSDLDYILHKKFFNCEIDGGVIGIGDNFGRNSVFLKIKQLVPDFNFETIVHPKAIVSKNVIIGNGTVLLPGTIVNNSCKIGNFCILNTKSSLDHDSVMEDFSSLAPGVTTGGKVTIGEFTAISLGANIIHNITIGMHCVIGAGALVLKTSLVFLGNCAFISATYFCVSFFCRPCIASTITFGLFIR